MDECRGVGSQGWPSHFSVTVGLRLASDPWADRGFCDLGLFGPWGWRRRQPRDKRQPQEPRSYQNRAAEAGRGCLVRG